MRFLPVKSKKGITLVESVIAVVVLAIMATGVLTMLTVGGTKIAQTSNEAAAHSEAMKQLDLAISGISNGGDYVSVGTVDGVEAGQQSINLDVDVLKNALGLGTDTTLTIEKTDTYDGSNNHIVSNVRGWYLKLSYKGATVNGFASNTRGVFDQ